MYSHYCNYFAFLSLFIFFYLTNQTSVSGEQLNPFTKDEINIVAAGDYYCNEETEKTISNIVFVKPEKIITTGDHVKEEKSADCWIQMSKPIHDRLYIAVGNHDAEFAKIYQQIVDYHDLESPYYSHDNENIHFISLSTEHPYDLGSQQYEFIKKDLEKASQNPNIDWIIVHQHKPFYSTKQDKDQSEELRDAFLPLFEKYGVDLVISSHNQYYERTYPISYNKQIEVATDDGATPQPIITDYSKSQYDDPKGIIFLTVGTAGDELDTVEEEHDYFIIQEDKFGFLNLKLENDGKTLVGQFHTNDGEMIDHFQIDKKTGIYNVVQENDNNNRPFSGIDFTSLANLLRLGR
jgi:predicted MPP superfamily phosphohydrolase